MNGTVNLANGNVRKMRRLEEQEKKKRAKANARVKTCVNIGEALLMVKRVEVALFQFDRWLSTVSFCQDVLLHELWLK